jgi:uncharacterized protein (DUF488 family)
VSHPEILTVGHSTHQIERFLALLRSAGVEAIADVRRYPGSRRNPQFGAEELAASLAAAGIGYEAFGAELGGRRSRRKAQLERSTKNFPPTAPHARRSKAAPTNSALRNPGFRAYADHMASEEFRRGLERLERVARDRRTAVMCAEAHPSRCHRALIADTLTARGWRVLHLLADGHLEPHRLSSAAVVRDGAVTYPGQATTRQASLEI